MTMQHHEVPDTFFIVETNQYGQGKTNLAWDLYQEFSNRGYRMAGFILRPVWSPAPEGHFVISGYDAFILHSRQTITVARADQQEWDRVDLFSHRDERNIARPVLYVDEDAMIQMFEDVMAIIKEGDIDATIIDEVGFLGIMSKSRKRSRAKVLVELVETVVAHSAKYNVVVFGNKHTQLKEFGACWDAFNKVADRCIKYTMIPQDFRTGAQYLLQEYNAKWNLVDNGR